MKGKAILLKCAIALVIIGCILAAGCTSTTTNPADTEQSEESSVSTSADANPMVGQWKTTYPYNNIQYSALMTLNADGSAYWYTYKDTILSNSADYLENANMSLLLNEKWNPTGDTTLTVQNIETGDIFQEPFQYVFDPVNETIQEISDTPVGTFTRVDDIVGVWSGPAKETAGTATSVMLINGIGFSCVVNTNGTVELTGLNWTKNADGTYAVAYTDGDSRTYTVSQDGTTLTTNDGRTKAKCFPNLPFITGVIGPWCNKDKMEVIALNGDGTGIFKGKNVRAIFNWKSDGNDKYIFTVTDGKDETGTSLNGKEIAMTFDYTHNAFLDSEGNSFVRPMESIKDLIQVV